MPDRAVYPVYNGYAPVEGGRVIPIDYDCSTRAVFRDEDLFSEQMMGKESFIQSIWVDNSRNPADVTIDFDTTRQRLRVKAGRQGYYNIHATNVVRYTLSTSVFAGTVQIAFLNIPVATGEW